MNNKRSVNFILKKGLKCKTRRKLRFFNIMVLSISLITGLISVKSRPMYRVSIAGVELGYIQNKQALEEKVKQSILQEEQKNIDTIDLKVNPEYTLTFIDNTMETKEEQMIQTVKQDAIVTYKYYELALDNQTIDLVNTLEEAEQLVNQVKEQKKEQVLDFSIIEKYTEKIEEVKTTGLEVAKNEIQTKVDERVEEIRKQKEETERINRMPEINGIKLAYTPIKGTITSRYGVSSRMRSSNHTGLDIAASTGTPIKVVASGTVTCATNKGAYGNMVKVNHGNGLETWYAHTSKMYVTEGQKVKAGEVIAAVGSTGNSTGPHLHLEIRLNGQHVNPQNYLY